MKPHILRLKCAAVLSLIDSSEAAQLWGNVRPRQVFGPVDRHSSRSKPDPSGGVSLRTRRTSQMAAPMIAAEGGALAVWLPVQI